MSVRHITIPPTLNVKDTVRGAKNPLMIGPTEVLWSTRTPEGLGTLNMVRDSDTTMAAEAWGDGAEWLLNQAPKLLGEDDDLNGFEPTGKIREFWRRKPFLLARTDRPWDSLVGGVFGQKVQVANAYKARRRLARQFGDPAPGPGDGWILPAPDRVAEMGYHQFHRLGVERKRAEILIRVAREMNWIGDMSAMTPQAVESRLQRIRGIGPWTAALVTATSFGHADAVPVGDFHIPNTIAWHMAGEPRGTDERMLELLEPYVGHRWRVIRLAKANGSAPKYGPKLSLQGDGLHLGR